MYVLRKSIYLDKPTQNYLTVLAVDDVPEAMTSHVRKIQFPVNSPFESRQCSCMNVMADANKPCRNGVYPSRTAQDYLQVNELGHAIKLWIQKGFQVNKDIYKILHEQDPNVVAVFH